MRAGRNFTPKGVYDHRKHYEGNTVGESEPRLTFLGLILGHNLFFSLKIAIKIINMERRITGIHFLP